MTYGKEMRIYKDRILYWKRVIEGESLDEAKRGLSDVFLNESAKPIELYFSGGKED